MAECPRRCSGPSSGYSPMRAQWPPEYRYAYGLLVDIVLPPISTMSAECGAATARWPARGPGVAPNAMLLTHGAGSEGRVEERLRVQQSRYSLSGSNGLAPP